MAVKLRENKFNHQAKSKRMTFKNKKLLIISIVLLFLSGAGFLLFFFNTSFLQKPAKTQEVASIQSTEPPVTSRLENDESLSRDVSSPKTTKGKLSIMLVGLGLYPELTEQALDLPTSVMLSYYPHSPEVKEQIEQATAKGFEVYLMCPMEPVYYPQNDPGPNTLLTGLPHEENIKRLQEILNIDPQIKGLVSYQGSLFMTSEEDLSPVVQYIAQHNKIFIDTSNTPQSKTYQVCKKQHARCYRTLYQLDQELSENALQRVFEQIEDALTKNDHVIVFGFAYPMTLEAIRHWIKKMDSSFKLTPLSHSDVKPEK